MRDLMIDIETMGVRPGAAVIQVAGVLFDPNNPSEGRSSMCLNISLADALLHGHHVDPGTLNWWREQGPEAQASLRDGLIYGQEAALKAFTQWLVNLEPHEAVRDVVRGDLRVWARGAAFDGPLLSEAYLRVGLQAPWHYRHLHELRTVELLARERGWPGLEDEEPIRAAWGAHHTALGDAHVQASQLQSALAWLEMGISG